MSLPVPISHRQKLADLKVALAHERKNLKELDAHLAEEQAAVNAFRMHCRLKIGDLLDTVYELRGEKQGLITRLEMLRQAKERGVALEDLDEFWQTDNEQEEPAEVVEETVEVSAVNRDKNAEKRLYRDLARRFHPDLAATNAERAYATSIMAAVNSAFKKRDMQALRDLSGEVDPSVVSEFDGIDIPEFNKLRTALMRCKRRRRRVTQQLKVLRKENTAQLWQEAQELDVDGRVWWSEVANTFAAEIDVLEADKTVLTDNLKNLRQAFDSSA